MGASFFAVFFFTALWGGVGIGLPMFVAKNPNLGPNKQIIQLMLVLTAFTCWLFWLCCYMAQMNPLIGPQLKGNTLLLMACEWEGHCLK